MKLNWKHIANTALIVIIIGSLSCKKETVSRVDYVISVDSITHQDTIAINENLILNFYGIIGQNGCYEFKKFDVGYENDSLFIIPWGTHTDQENCPEILPIFHGKKLIISGLTNGIKIINVIQADSIPIVSSVVVN